LRIGPATLPWIYLLPCGLFLLAMSAYPTVYALYLSLTNAQNSANGAKFIGLANYGTLIHDPYWWQSLQITITIVVFAVALEMILGFLIALWLNESSWGNGIMTLFILPLAASPVVVGYMFEYMYDGQLGLVTYLFGKLGIQVDLLANINTVVPAIIAVDVWEWTPFAILIFLAALKGVPDEALEAARIDGASYWQSVFHVIVPLMRTAAAVVLLFRLLDALKIFDVIYVMTRGGPGRSSEALSQFISENAFQNLNMGYATSIALVMLVIAVVATRFLGRIAIPEESW
jgi:multiple sugar transport system permease protein